MIKIQKRKLIQTNLHKAGVSVRFIGNARSNFSSPLINNWLLFYAIKRSKKHLGFTIVGFKGVIDGGKIGGGWTKGAGRNSRLQTR